jgi:hypothetical protein
MIAIGLLFVRMLCDYFKSRPQLEAEIVILRHQLNLLQRRAPRRPHLRWVDRALFIWLYRRCPRVLRAITVVRPETVLRSGAAGTSLSATAGAANPGYTDVLSPRMIRIIEELIGDWEHLDERIERVTDEIETLARADENCRRLMTVPGIGPIIAILFRPAGWAKHSFGPWLAAAARRLHRNVLATAFANKLARIALTVPVEGRSYAARVEPRAA